jgi:uncharacterized protein YndB with AHSA1/START domain
MKKVLKIVAVLIVLAGAGVAVAILTATNVRQLRDPATLTPDGKAQKTRTPDALDYSVAAKISAPPDAVWAVLTNASAYTQWNTTVLKLDGNIAQGSRIQLVVKDAPDRTFGLNVTEATAPKRMVWEDGNKVFMGVRTFTLVPQADGTLFAMSETLSGRMLGMIEPSLPDFTHSFETFAADLKKTAEARAAPPPTTAAQAPAAAPAPPVK